MFLGGSIRVQQIVIPVARDVAGVARILPALWRVLDVDFRSVREQRPQRVERSRREEKIHNGRAARSPSPNWGNRGRPIQQRRLATLAIDLEKGDLFVVRTGFLPTPSPLGTHCTSSNVHVS